MADIRINALATTAASTASDDFVAVDGSANGTRKLNAYSPTFGGNLTVSGTGTSSVAGNLQIGGAPNIAPSTIDRYSSVNVTNVADFPAFSLSVADGSKNVRGSMYIDSSTTQEQFAWDFSYSSASFPQYKWKIAGTTLATLRDNGNFILSSTGTDGGQKLQVSGTAAITGQTILGPSAISGNQFLSIKKDAINYGLIGLSNSNTAGYSSIELFDNTSTQTGAIGYGNASVGVTGVRGKVYMYSAGDIAFLSGGTTTALTLDSSQNATFAGTVTSGNIFAKRSDNTGVIRLIATSGVSAGSDIESFNAAGSSWNRLNFRSTVAAFYTGASANTLALTVDDSQNATFAGSIAIGNTVQTAVAVASTHKVTISIGGSTYYLLATNV